MFVTPPITHNGQSHCVARMKERDLFGVIEFHTVCLEIHYTHFGLLSLPQAAWIVGHRPPFEWPQRGELKFRNYDCDALYNLSPALRGLNLTILKGERVLEVFFI